MSLLDRRPKYLQDDSKIKHVQFQSVRPPLQDAGALPTAGVIVFMLGSDPARCSQLLCQLLLLVLDEFIAQHL